MKKLLMLLAFVGVFASCEKDEDVIVNINTRPTPENSATVKFNMVQEANTSKSVTRGNIPLYVENLTIKAVSRAQAPYSSTEEFTFTGDYNAAGGQSLSLPNVALGLNTFSATSKSAESNKVLLLKNSNATNLDDLKKKVPYIPTYTNNLDREILKGNNAPINLVAKSDHGRILGLFKIESNANKYVVVIESYVNGATTPSKVEIRPENTANRTATFEWSNEDAKVGNKVRFVIKICEAVSNTVLNTIEKSLTVQAEKSLSCTFSIGKDDVETDIQSGGITITFPKIEEIECLGGC